MDYLTSEEIAQKWDISTRRVTTLCKDGRIDGAVQKSGIWLIPHTAKKPENMKRGRMFNLKLLVWERCDIWAYRFNCIFCID